jgi:lipopolysaccharide export system permease protein
MARARGARVRGLPTVKRADRLIGASVLGALALVWLVLVGFDTLSQFLRQLGDIGKHGYTMAEAALYVAYTVPRRLYEMFGYSALIGGLMGLGALAASGELTALRAAGMSKLRIALSVTALIAVLTLAVVALGETLAPFGDQRAQAMQLQLHSGNLGLTASSGLWARDGDSIINARNSLAVGKGDHTQVRLADVRVFTFDGDGQLVKFDHADSAVSNGSQWHLEHLRETRLDAAGTHSTETASAPWQTRLSPQVLEQSVVHPEYLSMRDLRRNIRYMRGNGQNPGVYANAFWARALYPLNVLVLVLCAMPFAFGALRSGGLGKRLFMGILLAVGWYFLQQALTNLGTVYGVTPMLANLLPALALALAATLYFRRYG